MHNNKNNKTLNVEDKKSNVMERKEEEINDNSDVTMKIINKLKEKLNSKNKILTIICMMKRIRKKKT